MKSKQDLEELMETLFIEIGKYQTVVDEPRAENVFRMKQAYIVYQEEYHERFGIFYEPKSI